MAEERDQSRQRYPLVVEPPTGEPPLWIDERDRKGRPVEPTVKEAAGRIWRRVLYYVRRERNDHAEAAEVLEEAVFSVSARLQSEDELAPIQNLDSYLFHSFVRRFSSKRAVTTVLTRQGVRVHTALMWTRNGCEWAALRPAQPPRPGARSRAAAPRCG